MKPTTRHEADTPNRNGKPFTLYLNPATIEKFDALAEELNTTRSKHANALMERAISIFQKRRKKPN